MSACLNNTTVLGCFGTQTVAIHYVYDNAGAPKAVITNLSGVVVAGATLANTTLGVCTVQPVASVVTAGGAQVAGAIRAATPAFAGAVDNWDTSAVPDKLHSITVSARGVADGIPGATLNQVNIDLPDGTVLSLLNNETRTFSVTRDLDSELRRDYRVRVSGNAYASITYTFFA